MSYVSDVYLEFAESDYNENLHVVLSKGRMQLLTENAIYSYGDLYSNYKRAFAKLPLEKLHIQNVLILGFGLGSIPFMLEKNFKQKYHYTGVEIDETVMYLANKYVTQYLKSPIEMFCSDAFAFAMQTDETFDIIAVDVFIDAEIPSQFEQVDFLEQIKTLLGDNGILLYNRLYLTREDKETTRNFYWNTFLSVFPDGDYIDVGGNWILTNGKHFQ